MIPTSEETAIEHIITIGEICDIEAGFPKSHNLQKNKSIGLIDHDIIQKETDIVLRGGGNDDELLIIFPGSDGEDSKKKNQRD